MRSVIFALVVAASAMPTAAFAAQVHFTGETRANGVLIKDVLQSVLQYSANAEKCTSLTDVQATVLSGYQPTDARYRVGKGSPIYERWVATLCGKQVRFLVSYWPVDQGGSDFALGIPYPSDAP